MTQFLPEWTRQWGVMLAWPHAETDWAPMLEWAESTYVALSRAILEHEHLLILCRDGFHQRHIGTLLEEAGAATQRVEWRQRDYNDTWTRDYGPLSVTENGRLRLQDFRFNGWGNKHPADRDDRINRTLDWQPPLDQQNLVLEGGSVETDGHGTLLTTRACLLNPNRNPELDRSGLQARLAQTLGIRDIIWLEHGALEGDDTDAHVDTLARFCNRHTLAYVQCSDADDSHYSGLRRMEEQLQQEASQRGLSLLPLPLPTACFSDSGERLPATYANFLIINDAVLVPTYGVPTDAQAMESLAGAFPERRLIAVDCRALIEQHGSLHCATMQLPQGVF